MANYDASIRVSTKIDNSEIKEAEKEVDRLSKKLEQLHNKGDKLEALGVDKQSKQWKALKYDVAQVEGALYDAEQTLTQLNAANANSNMATGFDKAEASAKKLFSTILGGQKKSNSEFKSMNKMMVRMLAQMLLFRAISKTFEFVGAGIQNLSQYSEKLNSVLSDMKSQSATLKNSLATAFEPIVTTIIPYITRLISWLNTAMNYIAQFWAVFSGKDTYTRAKKQVVDYAKSLKDASGAAQGALASFDEINVLNKEEGSSAAGGEATGADAFEEAKVSGFSWIQEMKEALSGLVDYFIQPFVENKAKFEEALRGMTDVAQSVWESLKETANNTFGKFAEIYELYFKPFLDSIITGLSELVGAFMDFWNTYVQPVLDNLAVKFDEVMNAHIQPMIDRFLELLGSIAEAMRVFWEEVAQPLLQWIIENVLPVLMPIFENVATGIFELFAFVADIFENLIGLLKGVIDFVVAVFTGDWEGAWDAIKNILQSATDLMGSIIGMGFATIENIIKTVLDVIYGVVKAVFDGICFVISWVMERLDTIISGILGGISKNWLAAWKRMKEGIVNILNDVLWVVKDIVNNIISAIEMMVNGIIKGINFAIDALNGMGFDVPDWVPIIGGSSFHLNISRLDEVSIPRLATGGIVTSSTIANIGEAGREAVLPLENNTGWMDDLAGKLADELVSRMPIGNNNPIYLQVDGKTFARLSMPYLTQENRRIGVSLNIT